MKSNQDNVNHPTHYAEQGKVECIDFIGAVIGKYPGFIAGDLQNVIKYTWRSHGKNGKEDIEKAEWYLNHAEKQFFKLSQKQRDFLYSQQESLKEMTRTSEQITGEKSIILTGVREVTKQMSLREKELYLGVLEGVRNFYSDSSRTQAKKALTEWAQKYDRFKKTAANEQQR